MQKIRGLFLAAVLLPASSFLSAESDRSRLGIGFNYIGGQVRCHLNSQWAGELRYLTGSEEADTGKVNSQVLGLRGYRFIESRHRYRFFLGAETAYVGSDQNNTSYKTSGAAIGGFGGIEYRLGGRFALGFDIGPYLLSLKEKTKDVSDSSLEFVANTFFIFYVF
ncbi:MAG: hypothetical protein HY747_09055 [Elusimicrobia bacterium]|nr:hypothetical protein [Elusimicrobiota bacterium]